MPHRSFLGGTLVGGYVLFTAASLAQEADTDRDAGPLVTIRALDQSTGEPIASFRVVPAVPASRGIGGQSVAVWHPHLTRASENGLYEWPRERSYETFRLRIEADGYRPSHTEWLR